ncbi:MAG TPA: hypothetical protein VIF82_07825 [Burkholderiaceae bacterium]|jgi:hypothetical protein
MDLEQKLPGFLATRSIGDRRNEKSCVPPYSTGIGLVLIERRSGNDRRAASHPPQQPLNDAEKSDNIEMPTD